MKKYLLLSAMFLLSLTSCAVKTAGNETDSSGTTAVISDETTAAATETTEPAAETTVTEKTTGTQTVKTTAIKITTSEKTTTTTLPTDIPDGQLVRILDYIPDAVIDLRYATVNNFTGKVIYDSPEAYLCFGTVKKLMNVQAQLKEKGYRILIWDAYRPIEAQWALWNVCPDPNFVANPNNGVTSHGRGNTMDISIVHDKNGTPVEMPSAFDEFNASADRDYSDVSSEAASNALLLEEVMYANGFTGYRGEWWDYSDTERYDLILP